MPDECRDDTQSIIEFMTRYKDFWGLRKRLRLDRKCKAVGVEKSNPIAMNVSTVPRK